MNKTSLKDLTHLPNPIKSLKTELAQPKDLIIELNQIKSTSPV